MKYFFTILFLLPVLLSGAQTYDEIIRKADESYNLKDYSKATEHYIRAFKYFDGSATDFYNAACAGALAGNTEQALKWLNISVDKGWKDAKWMQSDTDLASLHNTPQWAELIGRVNANLTEYEKYFDHDLKARLEHIHVRDQTLRQLYREAEAKLGKDSDEMMYFWSLMAREDSLNELEVVAIIENYGWPGKGIVGGKANSAVWLVIQHAPLETQEKYLPLLRESVQKGESQGSHLALLEDRIRMRNDQPQIYGSQVVTNQETGKDEVYRIEDPEYVDQRRASVGLGPIAEYLKRWDIEWNVIQKLK